MFNSAKKLNNGQDVLVTAKMTGHTQYINCYIMCEHIGRYLLNAKRSSSLSLPNISWYFAMRRAQT